MNHEKMPGLLHDYARGRLSEEERLTVQRALENDPLLRAELERIRVYYNELKILPEVKAPADFLQKVRSRIEQKSFFEKLRDLIFFPLYIKLPIEIAGTVAAGLLVIIIFNPFSTKVNVKENYAVTEYKANSVETSRNALADNEISSDEKIVLEKKLAVAEHSEKMDQQPMTSIAKTGARRASKPSASFAEPMLSAQSRHRPFAADGGLEGGLAEKSNTAESEVIARDKADASGRAEVAAAAAQAQPSAMKAGAIKDAQQLADGYRSEADASSRADEVTRELAMSSSAPAPSSASGGVSINEQQSEPLAVKKLAELRREQFAYTWTPGVTTDYAPQSADYERLSKMEEPETKAAPSVRSKSKTVTAAKEESQVSNNGVAINKLKSDKLEYLKTSVKHAGGSLKAVNQGALQYRIKIPAKNFKQLEEELNKKGVFSSAKAVDLSRLSSNETVEIIINIQE
jgi:hypothetical protein